MGNEKNCKKLRGSLDEFKKDLKHARAELENKKPEPLIIKKLRKKLLEEEESINNLVTEIIHEDQFQ